MSFSITHACKTSFRRSSAPAAASQGRPRPRWTFAGSSASSSFSAPRYRYHYKPSTGIGRIIKHHRHRIHLSVHTIVAYIKDLAVDEQLPDDGVSLNIQSQKSLDSLRTAYTRYYRTETSRGRRKKARNKKTRLTRRPRARVQANSRVRARR